MTKLISIVNAQTGEQVVREMTTDELDEYNLGVNSKAEREAIESQAKADKLAILASLGLTEAQAIILGLIPDTAQSKKIASNEAAPE